MTLLLGRLEDEESLSPPQRAPSFLSGRGDGEDMTVGPELHSHSAPLPTTCVALGKLFTSLAFSWLLSPGGERQRERAEPDKARGLFQF